MLTGAALKQAILATANRPFRDTWWRAVSLAYQHDPLAKRRTTFPATRFNVLHGARILYVARDANTALMETSAFGAPKQARAVIPVEFALQAVLDLTDPRIRAALQISAADLNQNHRAVNASGGKTSTQELGETCAALGCIDGIVFESLADPPNPNLAIVVAALSVLGGYVKVDQPVTDRLP